MPPFVFFVIKSIQGVFLRELSTSPPTLLKELGVISFQPPVLVKPHLTQHLYRKYPRIGRYHV